MPPCRHWQTRQGPPRQRSPTRWTRPRWSQPSHGSVWHLGREGRPLPGEWLTQVTSPSWFPWSKVFPKTWAFRDNGESPGPPEARSPYKPNPVSAPGKLRPAQERGMEGPLASVTHPQGGWAGRYSYTPTSLTQVPPEARGANQRPIPPPWDLSSCIRELPSAPLGPREHKTDVGEGQGSPRMCWFRLMGCRVGVLPGGLWCMWRHPE